MTSRDFCFWLQGFFELGEEKILTKEQTELVKQHLQLVFKHEIDPSMGDVNHQKELDELHIPPKPLTWGPDGIGISDKTIIPRC